MERPRLLIKVIQCSDCMQMCLGVVQRGPYCTMIFVQEVGVTQAAGPGKWVLLIYRDLPECAIKKCSLHADHCTGRLG